MTKNNQTVLSAITLAGGITNIGSAKKTRIVRVDDGEVKNIYVNVDDIMKRGDKNKDVKLMPQDIIVVPESLF